MIHDLLKCPYCGSYKFGKLPIDPDKKYVLVIKDSTQNHPHEGTIVTVYGCAECGLISLQNNDINWNSAT